MTNERALQASPDAHLTTGQILSGLNTVRGVLAPDLSDEELRLFAMVASRSGLDPFARQVFAIKRKGRVTFQTGIDGYRSIAARTGMFDGQDEPEFGPMVGGHPEYATVRVYRKGVGRAIAATAYWDEYVPASGQDHMWLKMPRVMLAKVAEALALRKAFPYDPDNRQGIGADIYTTDEMAQAAPPSTPRPPAASLAEVAHAKATQTTQEAPPAPEPVVVVSVDDDEPDTTCGSVAEGGLMTGAVCILDGGHPAHHKSGTGSWPR